MKKVSDVIKDANKVEQAGLETACTYCWIHTAAARQIKDGEAYSCPHCKAPFDMQLWCHQFDLTVLGYGSTGFEDDDIMAKRLAMQCPDCSGYVMVELEPILYNGNHDVHYTSGAFFLSSEFEREIVQKQIDKANEKVRASVAQFIERIKKGDSLDQFTLELWTSRDIEGTITQCVEEIRKFEKKNRGVKA